MGEGSAVKFGDAWMETFECEGSEWTVNEGGEVYLFKDIAWREVREVWKEEARG